MRIAVLGATSQIAKDMVLMFAASSSNELSLYARKPDVVIQWMRQASISGRYSVNDFTDFTNDKKYDAILNFVGVGDPARAAILGVSILEITQTFDEMALSYLRCNPECRYIFLSSGAAYGSNFESPVDISSKAINKINSFQIQDAYGISKLYAECQHRLLQSFPIIDIRIFNYFSRTQDVAARYLISDIARSIKKREKLVISPEYMVRDFLNPIDFYQLINSVLAKPAANDVLDCYSLAPIDKPTLLIKLQEIFGLEFESLPAADTINSENKKTHYYSLNRRAAAYGYQPTLTSIDGIIIEMNAILQ